MKFDSATNEIVKGVCSYILTMDESRDHEIISCWMT